MSTAANVASRAGATESGGTLFVADLFVRPGGAVAAEHSHPHSEFAGVDHGFTHAKPIGVAREAIE